MGHDHSHHSPAALTHVGRAFVIGIFLNLTFVVVEFSAGFYTGSLALLSDAGHNLSDVASLALALFAFRIARRKADLKYTYGFHKSTILASLANAVILLITVGSIGVEAVERFFEPKEAEGFTISIVAGFGIVINTLSAWLFYRDREKDLNAKGAYLHLATDALVSAGVVLAGLLISYTHLLWIDPLISLVIMVIVIYSTWGLLTESLRLSIDAVPTGVDAEKVRQKVASVTGIYKVHHIHIWAMSTTRNAMTAHLVLEDGLSPPEVAQIKKELRHELEHLNIQHVTFETENKSLT